MALGACARSRLVEQHRDPIDRASIDMTLRTGDALVRSFEREARLLVIEERWSPLMCRVAHLAFLCIRRKLPGMRIFVATVAFCRGGVEPYMQHRPLHVGWPVALHAVHRPVRSHQREAGGIVIEPAQVVPVSRPVACLAAGRQARIRPRQHAVGELPSVHVLMAAGAGGVRKMESRQVRSRDGLVALIAGYRDVRSRQREAAFLVHGQRITCRAERAAIVAFLAPVQPWSGRKLPRVRVGVTVGADGVADLEPCLHASREMAAGTLHALVWLHQRKPGARMFESRKGARPPAHHRVACFATSPIRPFCKLTSMRICDVAVRTAGVCDRRFEVATSMATGAGRFQMLSNKWIGRPRVIELCFVRRFFPRFG